MSKKIKDLIWNTLGTTLCAFNSLFFLIIVKRINGIDNAGIFSFSFSMACLLYIIGIYSGRVFQVTDNDKEHDNISYLNVHFITSLFMIVISVFYCIVRNYGMYKSSVLILLVILKVFEALSDTFHSIIQKNDELNKVGFSLTIRSILDIFFFLLVDYFTKNLIFSIISVLITDFLILILYDIKASNINEKYFFNKKRVYDIFKCGFYAFLFTFLNLLLISIQKYAIDFYSVNKIQTIFGIIIMPTTVVSLVAQFAIHPFVLEINDCVKKSNYGHLINLIIKLSLFVVLFTIISVICAWFFGIPVLNAIYDINLIKYKTHLIVILFGAMFYSITSIFSNVLISLRETKPQAFIYFLICLISIVISLFLVKNYDIDGAVCSYFISMILIFVSFFILIFRVINRGKSN